MTDKESIKDLESQARNTRYLVDRINRAHYGMTVDEIIKSFGGKEDDERGIRPVQGNPREAECPPGFVWGPDDADGPEPGDRVQGHAVRKEVGKGGRT